MMNIATINLHNYKTGFLLPWSYQVNGFPFVKTILFISQLLKDIMMIFLQQTLKQKYF